ncbi:MAG: hypothetical protein M0C28_19225 [Candidatus Moduliflexus flocculans]|nr:hypothetical protein [Candidatus Moduliflexus flocculans]
MPAKKEFAASIRRAPDRGFSLTPAQTRTALKNALRYVPGLAARGDRPRVPGRAAARAAASTATASAPRAA